MKEHFTKETMVELLMGEGSQEEKGKLLGHVRECRECGGLYEQLQITLDALGGWKPMQPSAREWRGMLKRVRKGMSRERKRAGASGLGELFFSPIFAMRGLPAALLFCLGMAVGFYLTDTLKAAPESTSHVVTVPTPEVEQRKPAAPEKIFRLPISERESIELSEFDSRTLPERPKIVEVRARVKDSGQLIYWNFNLNGGE